MKHILIAGIGNIFLGDDAFGVEVAQELSQRPQPAEVVVTDFGIRSYDLAYALTEDYDAVILVDATVRGGPPGTVYLIELDRGKLGRFESASVDAHSLNPRTVLQLAEAFGELPEQLYLVGCEPAEVDSPEGQVGLSAAVAGGVPRAIEMVEALVAKLLNLRTKKESGLAPAGKEKDHGTTFKKLACDSLAGIRGIACPGYDSAGPPRNSLDAARVAPDADVRRSE